MIPILLAPSPSFVFRPSFRPLRCSLLYLYFLSFVLHAEFVVDTGITRLSRRVAYMSNMMWMLLVMHWP